MKNIDDILSEMGYSDIPDISEIKSFMTKELSSWVESINFKEALNFYGLTSHAEFMKLFQPYLDLYYKNSDLQCAAFVLNQYLFDNKKYNWERKFDRNVEDMFAAVVLLSGYKKHIENMKRLNFDTDQIEKH